MNKRMTHSEALRLVAKGLIKAGLANWAKSCEEAAKYIDEMEYRLRDAHVGLPRFSAADPNPGEQHGQ